jgi:hypothetical protein
LEVSPELLWKIGDETILEDIQSYVGRSVDIQLLNLSRTDGVRWKVRVLCELCKDSREVPSKIIEIPEDLQKEAPLHKGLALDSTKTFNAGAFLNSIYHNWSIGKKQRIALRCCHGLFESISFDQRTSTALYPDCAKKVQSQINFLMNILDAIQSEDLKEHIKSQVAKKNTFVFKSKMSDQTSQSPKCRRTTSPERRTTTTTITPATSSPITLTAKKNKLPYEIVKNIFEFANNIICPIVLKINTPLVEGVQRVLILYDPPSPTPRSSIPIWDDGKLGTSSGCKLNLSQLPPEEKIQYIKSLIKLTRNAGEIMTGGRCRSIGLDIKTQTKIITLIVGDPRRRRYYPLRPYNLHFQIRIRGEEMGQIDGHISDTGEVVIDNQGGNYVADFIINSLSSECEGYKFIKSSFFVAAGNVPISEFEASVCIKRY